MLVKFRPHKPSNRFLDRLEHLVSEEPNITLHIQVEGDHFHDAIDTPTSKRPFAFLEHARDSSSAAGCIRDSSTDPRFHGPGGCDGSSVSDHSSITLGFTSGFPRGFVGGSTHRVFGSSSTRGCGGGGSPRGIGGGRSPRGSVGSSTRDARGASTRDIGGGSTRVSGGGDSPRGSGGGFPSGGSTRGARGRGIGGGSTRGSRGASTRGTRGASTRGSRGASTRGTRGASTRGSRGASTRGTRGASTRGSGGGYTRGSRGASTRGIGGGSTRGSRGGSGHVGSSTPHGYTTSDHPIVGGPGPCPHCFCSPCILSNPPSFLVGSSAADIRNANKRFILYGNFWRLLKDIGLWNYEPYLVRKSARTLRADVREIIPSLLHEGNKTKISKSSGHPIQGLSLYI